jgi:hypothetical protein
LNEGKRPGATVVPGVFYFFVFAFVAWKKSLAPTMCFGDGCVVLQGKIGQQRRLGPFISA